MEPHVSTSFFPPPLLRPRVQKQVNGIADRYRVKRLKPCPVTPFLPVFGCHVPKSFPILDRLIAPHSIPQHSPDWTRSIKKPRAGDIFIIEQSVSAGRDFHLKAKFLK